MKYRDSNRYTSYNHIFLLKINAEIVLIVALLFSLLYYFDSSEKVRNGSDEVNVDKFLTVQL